MTRMARMLWIAAFSMMAWYASASATELPVDPVIEEPIRPLMPAAETSATSSPAPCGNVGALTLPLSLLLLQMLSRRRGG